MNTLVNQEDNGKETETRDDEFLTWEHLLQMHGLSTTLIGHVNGPEKLATKAGGCGDGDTVANLELIQVRGVARDVDH